jgi:hypothetical protein
MRDEVVLLAPPRPHLQLKDRRMSATLLEITAETDCTLDRQIIDNQTGQPADITGFQFEFTVRRRPGRLADTVLTKTTAANRGITFPSPTTGMLEIAIAATDTGNELTCLAGLHIYELARTDTGNREVLESGWLLIKPSITPLPTS